MKNKLKISLTFGLACILVFSTTLVVYAATVFFNPFTVENGGIRYTPTYTIDSGTHIRLDLTTSQLALIKVGCVNASTREVVGSSGLWNTYGGYWEYTIPSTGRYAFFFENRSAPSITFSNVAVSF